MNANSPLLRVNGLSIQFGALRALDDVTFDIAPGELLALIGPNGAGKTTVLNALAGELTPTSGTILFNGQMTAGLSPNQVVARGLARTFQAAEPFQHLTVRENVIVGNLPASGLGMFRSLGGRGLTAAVVSRLTEDADRHLAEVGLLDKADQPASLLTAGQRRLLSIARVLATGAKVLVLDEPGAGLNEAEKTFLGNVILSLWQSGKSILFVDHDMPLVSRIAQRIMVLDRGRVIADGEPDAVRRDPRVLEAYLGSRKTGSEAKAAPVVALEGPAPERRTPLDVDELSVNYAGLCAVDKVSLSVGAGEIVALVGANGAGKSSMLRAIAGMEAFQARRLAFDGVNMLKMPTDKVVAMGVNLVPEGRALFGSLTVQENLAAGRYAIRRAQGFSRILVESKEERRAADELLEDVYELFPILKERASQLAGTLSGGQGQMLAIGRALMGAPRLLMLDEPSLGIAPQIVDEIFASITNLRRRGLTILLVEQYSAAALAICDRGCVLSNGNIVASGTGSELLADPKIAEAYLGGSRSNATESQSRAVANA